MRRVTVYVELRCNNIGNIAVVKLPRYCCGLVTVLNSKSWSKNNSFQCSSRAYYDKLHRPQSFATVSSVSALVWANESTRSPHTTEEQNMAEGGKSGEHSMDMQDSDIDIVRAPAAFKSKVWKRIGCIVSRNEKREKVTDKQQIVCKTLPV